MEILSAVVREELFKDEDQQSELWIGAPLAFFSEKEVIPFKFLDDRYAMIFQRVGDAAGGEEYVAVLAPDFAGGYVPDVESRIMKFARADATVEAAYSPDLWRLPDYRYIYQFLDVLRSVVELHVLAYPHVSQYFYTAATAQLQLCYARVFRRLPDESCLKDFEPVEAHLGNYYGFQRKQSGQHENLANEAR